MYVCLPNFCDMSFTIVFNPTAIRVFDEETYLVAETNKLALYDLRVGEREGCVQYLQLNETVACLAVGTEGMPGGLQVRHICYSFSLPLSLSVPLSISCERSEFTRRGSGEGPK